MRAPSQVPIWGIALRVHADRSSRRSVPRQKLERFQRNIERIRNRTIRDVRIRASAVRPPGRMGGWTSGRHRRRLISVCLTFGRRLRFVRLALLLAAFDRHQSQPCRRWWTKDRWFILFHGLCFPLLWRSKPGDQHEHDKPRTIHVATCERCSWISNPSSLAPEPPPTHAAPDETLQHFPPEVV